MLLSSGKMNGAVDGERKGRCVHVSVCLCVHMQKSVLLHCLPPRDTLLACSQTTKHTIHIYKHSCVICSAVYCTVCACKYVHVVVDYRVEADISQCKSTSHSFLINEKHHLLSSGSTSVSDLLVLAT